MPLRCSLTGPPCLRVLREMQMLISVLTVRIPNMCLQRWSNALFENLSYHTSWVPIPVFLLTSCVAVHTFLIFFFEAPFLHL